MKIQTDRICIAILICLNSHLSWTQAPGNDPEKGKGTYKNRVFFDLEKYWDSTRVCNNPHKGLCIHYYDNSISNYGNHLKHEWKTEPG
jgi:hypothetical protein